MGRKPKEYARPESILEFDFQELYLQRFPERECAACPPKNAHSLPSFRNVATCSSAVLLECDHEKLFKGKKIEEFSFKGAPGFDSPWNLGKLGSADGYHLLILEGSNKKVRLRFDAVINMRLVIGNAGTRHFIHGYRDGCIEDQMESLAAMSPEAKAMVRTCNHSDDMPNRIWNDCGLASIVGLPFLQPSSGAPGLIDAKNASPLCGNPFLLFHVIKMVYFNPQLRSTAKASPWLFSLFEKADSLIPADGRVKFPGALDGRFSAHPPSGLKIVRALDAVWDDFFALFGSGEEGWGRFRDSFFLSGFEDAEPLVKTPPSTWNAEILDLYVASIARAKERRIAELAMANGGGDAMEALLELAWR